jgi:hypothetical protein
MGGSLTLFQVDIKDRWASSSLIRLLSKVLWIKASSGLARHAGTKSLFEPLRPETIYYLVTCLAWAIKEYQTGTKTTVEVNSEFESESLPTALPI